MTRPFQSYHIEYHILQSFPVTCLNRDDVGAPKSAVVGGITRARVSSQCWKRQVRMGLRDLGISIGVRTTAIKEMIAKACKELGAEDGEAEKCGQQFASIMLEKEEKDEKGKKNKKISETNNEAEDTSNADDGEKEKKKEGKDNILLFWSSQETKAIADYAKRHKYDFGKDKKKAAEEIAGIAKKALCPAQDGLDIALFGRMVAKAATMNVEAAASFAHALSTHEANNDMDFFTALDDLKDEPGSAHMGSLEYNSATYYRYISLDLGQLYANLFDAAPCDAEHIKHLVDAVEVFTKALYLAVPPARQKTLSGASFWDYAHILFRKGQCLQVSFEKPVRPDEGYLEPSIAALESFLRKKEKEAGSLFQKQGEIRFGEGIENSNDVDKCSVDEVLASLREMIQKVKP